MTGATSYPIVAVNWERQCLQQQSILNASGKAYSDHRRGRLPGGSGSPASSPENAGHGRNCISACYACIGSRCRVYGDPSVHPQTEDYWGNVNPIGIRSCYDQGKCCAESLFFAYRRQNKVSIKVARIFNTYGPRMHPNGGRVVSNFIVQALLGRDITIYGDGSQTCSFDDLIDGLISLMELRMT